MGSPVRTALVFGGAPVEPVPRLRQRLDGLAQPVFAVAADAGAATALAFGWVPHVVIGDLDSIQPDTLAALKRRDVPIEVFPRDKAATDGQLAVERALQRSPQELVLVGYLGGPRLDQALANVLLLAGLRTPTVLLDERNECRLLRDGEAFSSSAAWQAEANEVVSLLPISQQAEGVRTHGLRWVLDGERLIRGQTRGISNEPVASQVGVSIERGLLLVTRHFPAP